MKQNTQYYFTKIMKETGFTFVEIRELVNKKIQELKGLISLEGALTIIAQELGVDIRKDSENNSLFSCED